MTPTEWKMQPTIHCCCKPGYSWRPYSLLCKCIVGCIFNSVGLITQACKTKLFNRCFDFDN
jgi:hypothetical protein